MVQPLQRPPFSNVAGTFVFSDWLNQLWKWLQDFYNRFVIVETLLASNLKTQTLEYTIAHTGETDGKAAYILNIFGTRSEWNSTSVLGDCADYLNGSQDKINTPSSASTLYIASTSAQDAVAGTGADMVRIVYLDANGIQQVTNATLTGLTPVSLGTGFSFIQWIELSHSTTDDRIAAGNIHLTDLPNALSTYTTAQLEAGTYEFVRAGGNRSQSFRYKVPANYHAHLLDYDCESQGTTMQARLRATVLSDDGSLSNAYHFLDTVVLASGSTHNTELRYRELPPLCVIKLSAIPTAKTAGNRLSGSLHIMLIEG